MIGQPGLGKQKKGRGPATKRQQRRRRERAQQQRRTEQGLRRPGRRYMSEDSTLAGEQR